MRHRIFVLFAFSMIITACQSTTAPALPERISTKELLAFDYMGIDGPAEESHLFQESLIVDPIS